MDVPEGEALRQVMLEQLDRLDRRIAALRRSLDDIVEAASMSNVDDEHDPEGTTIAFERAQVSALLRDVTAEREAVSAALGRLDSDARLPACETCGGPIGLERLEALPAARRCITCAR